MIFLEGDNRKFGYRVQGPSAALFGVDEHGVVSAKEVFDREATSVHRFQVLAVDSGAPSLTGSTVIVVSIKDVNDERPAFIHSTYTFSVFENEPVGTSVGSASARDRDLPPHNVCVYALRGDSAAAADRFFAVDAANGTIRTREPLDRENQPLYHLVVAAFEPQDMTSSASSSSSPYSSTANVIVSVVDRNDNAPAFTFPSPVNFTVSVSTLVPAGHAVATLSATDADSDRNARITYRIVDDGDDDSGYFQVDPIQGSVFVVGDLSPLTAARMFRLRVTATDHGVPPLSTDAHLHVVANDSIPFSVRYNRHQTTVLGLSNRIILLVSVGCGVLLLLSLVVAVGVCLAVRRARSERGRGKYSCRMESVDMLTVAPKEFKANSSVEGTPVKKLPLVDNSVNFDKSDSLAFAQMQVSSLPGS